MNDLTLRSLPCYGSGKQTLDLNTNISDWTIKFLKNSGLSDEPLMCSLGTYWCISFFRIYIYLMLDCSFFLVLVFLINSKNLIYLYFKLWFLQLSQLLVLAYNGYSVLFWPVLLHMSLFLFLHGLIYRC